MYVIWLYIILSGCCNCRVFSALFKEKTVKLFLLAYVYTMILVVSDFHCCLVHQILLYNLNAIITNILL